VARGNTGKPRGLSNQIEDLKRSQTRQKVGGKNGVPKDSTGVVVGGCGWKDLGKNWGADTGGVARAFQGGGVKGGWNAVYKIRGGGGGTVGGGSTCYSTPGTKVGSQRVRRVKKRPEGP